MDAHCPGCGGRLDEAIDGAHSGRHYVCEGCGSFLIAVAVLRKLLADGAAQHLWTGDGEAAGGGAGGPGPCPFCTRAMLYRQVANGHAAICKTCQMVWLDRPGLASLPAAAAAPGRPAEETVASLRCENCGAQITSPYEEKCRFCDAALVAPTKVVVIPAAPADHQPAWTDAGALGLGAGRLVSGVASLLDWFGQ